MNLEYLKTFLVVGQVLNFTKASQLLHLSQPTISKQIKALEAQLQTSLLVRDTHNVLLTPAGQLLLDRGPAVIKNTDDLEALVLSTATERIDVIKISSSNYYNRVLFDFFWEFQQEHPNIKLMISHHSASTCINQLQSDAIDVAITYSYAMQGPTQDLASIPIGTDRYCLLVNHLHPFASKKSITPAELLTEHDIKVDPIALAALSEVKTIDAKTWNMFLHDVVSRSEGRISSDDIILMVRTGSCMAVMPYSVASQHKAGCGIVELDGLETAFKILLIWKKSESSAIIRGFIDAIRARLGTR